MSPTPLFIECKVNVEEERESTEFAKSLEAERTMSKRKFSESSDDLEEADGEKYCNKAPRGTIVGGSLNDDDNVSDYSGGEDQCQPETMKDRQHLAKRRYNAKKQKLKRRRLSDPKWKFVQRLVDDFVQEKAWRSLAFLPVGWKSWRTRNVKGGICHYFCNSNEIKSRLDQPELYEEDWQVIQRIISDGINSLRGTLTTAVRLNVIGEDFLYSMI